MSMTSKTLTDAVTAAQAFLDAVDALQDRRAKDDYFQRMHGIVGFKETAAVRRTSMTLTRALADLRRPS